MVAPNNIPLAIEVDLAELTFDSRISVGDLNLPEGATTEIPENISVAAAVLSRAAAMADEEEEAEGEEGEEGEGEEGEGEGDAEGSDDDAAEGD